MLPGWPGRTSQEAASPKAHTGEEFGRPPSSQMVSASTVPGRMAATTQVILDGVVERESGVTPAPPRISIKTIFLVLVALFLIGVAIYVFYVARLPLIAG